MKENNPNIIIYFLSTLVIKVINCIYNNDDIPSATRLAYHRADTINSSVYDDTSRIGNMAIPRNFK